MRAMAAMGMAMPASSAWTLTDWGTVASAWAVMMAAMMVPASWPVLALLQRYGSATLVPLLGGYLTVWSAFSGIATGVQWALSQGPWFDPLTLRLHSALGGAVLLAAAAYQFTPLKRACLSRCQSPFTLLMSRWRPGFIGTLKLGLYHGVFCVGCCWALMLVLFAVGAMNVYGAAILALASGAERWFPPPWPERVVAVALLVAAPLFWFVGFL